MNSVIYNSQKLFIDLLHSGQALGSLDRVHPRGCPSHRVQMKDFAPFTSKDKRVIQMTDPCFVSQWL